MSSRAGRRILPARHRRRPRRSLAPLGMTSLVVGVCVLAAPVAHAQDSTFLLATGDPARSPSPAIGNGRLGVVIPALGIGPSHSFLAGLFEEAPGDVPRIAALPGWNAVA